MARTTCPWASMMTGVTAEDLLLALLSNQCRWTITADTRSGVKITMPG